MTRCRPPPLLSPDPRSYSIIPCTIIQAAAWWTRCRCRAGSSPAWPVVRPVLPFQKVIPGVMHEVCCVSCGTCLGSRWSSEGSGVGDPVPGLGRKPPLGRSSGPPPARAPSCPSTKSPGKRLRTCVTCRAVCASAPGGVLLGRVWGTRCRRAGASGPRWAGPPAQAGRAEVLPLNTPPVPYVRKTQVPTTPNFPFGGCGGPVRTRFWRPWRGNRSVGKVQIQTGGLPGVPLDTHGTGSL